jgi:hypothetical protein
VIEKIVNDFNLFGIQTHPIPPNPHGLRAKRTSSKKEKKTDLLKFTRVTRKRKLRFQGNQIRVSLHGCPRALQRLVSLLDLWKRAKW